MSRRALVAVLVALLTASAFLVLAPSQGNRVSTPTSVTPGPAEAAHPAAAPTYTILDGYGYATDDFYVGEVGWGSFCFIVTDPLDHAVNVTITDPNAARDGVATPAFHYEAVLNATTSTFDSYTSGVSYAFPAALPYGGHWVVNFSAPNAGHVDQNVSVHVYDTELSSSVGSGSTLPGQPVSVFWWLYLDSNGNTLYTRATSVWIIGSYTGNGTVHTLFPTGPVALTPANAGEGVWSGSVPANTTPDSELHFEVYAVTNLSGQVVENESSNLTIYVGTIDLFHYGITTGVPACSFVHLTDFPIGGEIASCVLAGSDFLGAFTPIAGLTVSVDYWNGTAHVSPVGAPTALTTNSSGEAAFTFLATVPPFIPDTQSPVYNALNLSVSVPGASTHYPWTAWRNASWLLYPGSSATGAVQVSLDNTQYYAGNTAVVNWSISSSNVAQTGKISATVWVVSGPNDEVYAAGNLSSTAQSGTFTFGITAAMETHTITVYVYAANATTGFDGYASAAVLTPSLLLSPANNYYTAGSSDPVVALLNGGGATSIIQYQVWGVWSDEEGLLSSGTVLNGGSIPVAIASTSPPLTVEVGAWASQNGQVIATKTVYLNLAVGYQVQLGVKTASNYVDGSFQPGQTLTLSYAVLSTGGAALPKVATFEILAVGYPFYQVLQNVALSGTFSFTVPSNAVQGTLFVELEVVGGLTGGTCLPLGECLGIASLPINPNPSVLNLELGAGSGLTVGWLILLILVIVVAVLFFFVLRRRGGRGPAPSSSTSASSSLNPPAPAPSTEPASEWKAPPPPEPSPEPSGDNSPPRLPEPPSGSQ